MSGDFTLFHGYIALLWATGPSHPDTTVLVFLAEVTLMLIVGRALGEVMLRLRQPEVMGQLLAGIVLGPTVLGNVWPGGYQLIFPATPELRNMIDALSQLGILMLLVLAGMEIDFAIVKARKSTAFFASISGIVLPFACGFALGQMLPESFLPAADKRLVTSLFLATALSISSIKIVAMVIMEVNFMRRNIGQLILASAIIDDTIGWIIVAVISGLAAEGVLNLKGVGFTVVGTATFLFLSFKFGPTLIAHLVRWTNDNLRLDFAVLSVIMILMCLMAILTDLIGVHTVLGGFMCGILVGRSPIMTDQIRAQLRGLIIAFFAPIFFAVAGLSVDLTILRQPRMFELAIGLILIASFGKLAGCFTGGLLGKLSTREAVALAIGMNARGTTEVIVATIGLSIGVLTKDFYTLIVVMAVTTTMVMPPLLRWALKRIPLTGAEKERLEKEEAESKDYLPKVERLLLAADEGDCGQLAAVLGGLFVGIRKIIATVVDLEPREKKGTTQTLLNHSIANRVKMAVEAAAFQDRKKWEQAEGNSERPPAQLTNLTSQEAPAEAIVKELANGYDMMFVGLEEALRVDGKGSGLLGSSIEKIVRGFKGVIAIAVARGDESQRVDIEDLNILVPTTGTYYSRVAAEVAIAIARAAKSEITAFNVSPPVDVAWFRSSAEKQLKPGREVVKDIQQLGEREGVTVKTKVQVKRSSETAILTQIRKGGYNLVVVGANVRPGQGLFFGHSIRVLLEKTPCSLLIVSS